MFRNHRHTALFTAAIVAGAMVLPRAAEAGDREWAAAGKILTGVVAAHLLSGSLHSNSDRRVEHTTVYYPQHQPRYDRPRHRRPVVRYQGCSSVYRPQRSVVVEERVVVQRPRVIVAPHCDDPVIVRLDYNRRLFQPRIRGHVAYLQVWDDHCNDWRTVDEYPCIY